MILADVVNGVSCRVRVPVLVYASGCNTQVVLANRRID